MITKLRFVSAFAIPLLLFGAAPAAQSSTTGSLGSPGSLSSISPPAPRFEAPFIASVEWIDDSRGGYFAITPTDSGRESTGRRDEPAAWTEVVALAPTIDTPGMRAQFTCHWDYVRAADPDKPTWNLEPWRPVVSEEEMVLARCNP